MNNKNILYLLICNLITFNTSACNFEFHDNNLLCSMKTIHTNGNSSNNVNINKVDKSKLQLLKRNNKDLRRNYQFSTKQINKNFKESNVVRNNNGYININNDELNCSIISLIHSLKTLNGFYDDLISSINNRYTVLNEIQYFKEDYTIHPVDIILDFDKYDDIFLQSKPQNYDSDKYELNCSLLSIKQKLIQYENIIANIIYSLRSIVQNPYNTNDSNNIEIVKQIEDTINNVLDKLQNINDTIYKNLDLKNIHSINDIIQSNSDPIEILEKLANVFNNKVKFNKSVLPVSILSSNKSNNKILEGVNLKNNLVINYSNLFINYNKKKNSNILNTKSLNAFINKIDNKLSIKNSKIDLSLTSVLVAFFDTKSNNVFHYASIMNRSDNKWLLIDSDKQYDKNNTGTLHNSLQDILKQDELITQYVPDDLLYDDSYNSQNERKYKLVPVALFYTKTGYSPSSMSVSYIFDPHNENEIKQFNITSNNILKNDIIKLNSICDEINKLDRKVNNILNNNESSSESDTLTQIIKPYRIENKKSTNNYILDFNSDNNKSNVLHKYYKGYDEIINSLNELNSKFDNNLKQNKNNNKEMLKKKKNREYFDILNIYKDNDFDSNYDDELDSELDSISELSTNNTKIESNKIKKTHYGEEFNNSGLYDDDSNDDEDKFNNSKQLNKNKKKRKNDEINYKRKFNNLGLYDDDSNDDEDEFNNSKRLNKNKKKVKNNKINEINYKRKKISVLDLYNGNLENKNEFNIIKRLNKNDNKIENNNIERINYEEEEFNNLDMHNDNYLDNKLNKIKSTDNNKVETIDNNKIEVTDDNKIESTDNNDKSDYNKIDWDTVD